MFDPRDPYERYHWHYDSRRPLSIAQIIASQSVDVETVALVWLLLEQGASLTVAGPTDPQPGVGKSTTVNALLQFLPEGSALVYMSGMVEDFAFTSLPGINPATTYALCNEVSDHSPIYMWESTAQRYLKLPAQGYHIVTSVHADTINDVIRMYHYDLRLTAEDVRRLGLIINIGLIGEERLQRRWFTTHFLRPQADPRQPEAITVLPLSSWNDAEATFNHADQSTLFEVAKWIGLPLQAFMADFKQRVACLRILAQGKGIDMHQMRTAINEFRASGRVTKTPLYQQ